MLIQVKCQNCGSNIKVDKNNKEFVCEHCGAEFILEETVNNFQTVNQYHTTQNIVKHVYGKDAMDATDFIQNADVFVSLGEFGKAEDLYNKAINANPADWRGWFGIVKVRTLNFSKIEDKTHLEFLSKAKKVATKEQQLEIEEQYRKFSLKVEKERQRKEELQHKEYLRKQELQKQQKLEEERRKKRKKMIIISLIIIYVIAAIIFIFIFVNQAKEKEADLKVRNGLILEEKEDYYIVTGIERFNENIVIPSQYKGKDVKEFEEDVFSGNDNIKSITIPDSIVEIADGAFANCDNLTTVSIGDSVSRIGTAAFNSCPLLTNVSLGNGLVDMGTSVFLGCESLKYNEYENLYYLGNNDNPYMCLIKDKDVNITNCVIHEKTKFICDSAFSSYLALESITFGKSIVNIIGDLNLFGLKNIYFLGELTDWLLIDGLWALMDDGRSSKNLYINGQILTDVVIPDTITSIPNSAFCGTTIKSLMIGEGVVKIGWEAFRDCSLLEKITFHGTWTVTDFKNGGHVISSSILEDCDTIKYYLTSYYSNYMWTRMLDA